MRKTRKDRSDIQVGNLEKKHNLQPGAVRNTDQTDARSDKELGTLQREYGEQAMQGMLEPEANPTNSDKSKAKD
ncbi:hypothetical protein [Spirosoma koreense]